ncbi:MAG TPA: phosphatase PAP2 family protein [Xanthobacteraceae bacterium]|jgi:membrane-associated phospholipid phosphatase
MISEDQTQAAVEERRKHRIGDLEKWAIWLVLTAVAVAVSYFWIDRRVALIVHGQLRGINLFEKLTLIPDVVTPVVLVAFVAVGMSGLSGRVMSRLQTVAVLAAASLAVAEIIKDNLKYVFGRTWPETWVRNNPSFIHNGVYGFHPFHGGQGYASFPSGHTTAICAVMSVLWICYPRLRPIYAICIAAVAIGLVGANFHFVSDVIAGAFLGTTTGWLTVVVWEIGDHKVRPQ